ncbi:Hpt domain-containing protein [Flavobacterium sp. 20NA77.7]|uniref:Hpt domain-containing protein n=1 Tax=Flavobacterium nakdongensis TaxID=3073563 RepID=A0ABY9RC70_9FLAO|nr:Hpt domain-containing protein [Flavobacterium sp. 20NA77.7]WMW78433.1 Hpt domain-containing protein [Flavobacterium sp. 20NA77.7]
MALQYNLSKVYEISENDKEFALQILSLFLQEVPVEIKIIKEAIEDKQYDKSYAAAHKIKPTLDLLGMDLAYEDNLLIMNWSKEAGKRKEIKDVYKSLKEKIDAAVLEIKKDFKL